MVADSTMSMEQIHKYIICDSNRYHVESDNH